MVVLVRNRQKVRMASKKSMKRKETNFDMEESSGASVKKGKCEQPTK